jgi:hypothetical protein
MSLRPVRQADLNKSLLRAALGLALGLIGATSALADPTLTYVAITSQTPTFIIPGQSAAYTVTANRTGKGSMDVYCSIAGLPVGATAKFSPAVITFLEDDPSAKSATLTISTTDSIAPGIYPFVITGRHGNGSKSVSCPGTLVISAGTLIDLPQRIVSVDCQPEGSVLLNCSGRAGRTYVIQRSASLTEGSWANLGSADADANGRFTYLDTTAVGCACRFYRTSTP